MLCRRSVHGAPRVAVVLARDADDSDVTEALAAALLTSSTVRLPGSEVCHPCRVAVPRNALSEPLLSANLDPFPPLLEVMVLTWQRNGKVISCPKA